MPDRFAETVHFSKLKKELEPQLFDVVDMRGRIRIAERYLLSHMHPERCSHILMEAMAEILRGKGSLGIGQLSKEIHVSSRQLERVFRKSVGIAPKQLSSLIRYQYLWNDILFGRDFCVQDAVCRYGYTDQAHLLHDFKRFHSMTIPGARKYAREHVAFFQEKI